MMKDIKEDILAILKNYPEIELCLVFGSAARNCLKPESDIDIAVAADRKLTTEKKLSLIMDLAAILGREVDVLDVSEVSGPILQQSLCTGKIILNENKMLYAGLIKKMWFNQADMMGNYNMILRKRREKFLYG